MISSIFIERERRNDEGTSLNSSKIWVNNPYKLYFYYYLMYCGGGGGIFKINRLILRKNKKNISLEVL